MSRIVIRICLALVLAAAVQAVAQDRLRRWTPTWASGRGP